MSDLGAAFLIKQANCNHSLETDAQILAWTKGDEQKHDEKPQAQY